MKLRIDSHTPASPKSEPEAAPNPSHGESQPFNTTQFFTLEVLGHRRVGNFEPSHALRALITLPQPKLVLHKSIPNPTFLELPGQSRLSRSSPRSNVWNSSRSSDACRRSFRSNHRFTYPKPKPRRLLRYGRRKHQRTF